MRKLIPFVPGQRFGRLSVLSEKIATHSPTGRPHRHRVFVCRCDCGAVAEKSPTDLARGRIQSCGCYNREFQRIVHTKHGLAGTPEYGAWVNLRSRCEDPSDPSYHLYGARGIKVCPEWSVSFERFLTDMGPRPSGAHSLDRTDNDAGYSKENCRWVTATDQNRNRRGLHMLTWRGRTQTMTDWSNETGISLACIIHRLKVGWSMDATLTKPSLRAPR